MHGYDIIPMTAASLMLMNGVDMKTVSMILGHGTIGITVDTYRAYIREAYPLLFTQCRSTLPSDSMCRSCVGTIKQL
jgi:hypothetical protein